MNIKQMLVIGHLPDVKIGVEISTLPMKLVRFKSFVPIPIGDQSKHILLGAIPSLLAKLCINFRGFEYMGMVGWYVGW